MGGGELDVSSNGGSAPPRLVLAETTSWSGSVPQQLPLPVMADVPVAPGSLPSLAKALEAVPEHRRPRGFRAEQPPVPLIPTLLLLLVSVLCGRRGYIGIAEWAAQCARAHPEVLDALGFAAGRRPRTPATATLFRLVRDMHFRQFQEAVQGWVIQTAVSLRVTLPARERTRVPEDQIALDGKTVRGAAARREGPAPIRLRLAVSGPGDDDDSAGLHLVAAYVPALEAVLDQLATDGKGRELAAAELLLGRLPLKGHVYTGDALLTQREVCKTVIEGEGDYLLPAKENQPSLLADLREAFSPSTAARSGESNATGRECTASDLAADAAGCTSDCSTA